MKELMNTKIKTGLEVFKNPKGTESSNVIKIMKYQL